MNRSGLKINTEISDKRFKKKVKGGEMKHLSILLLLVFIQINESSVADCTPLPCCMIESFAIANCPKATGFLNINAINDASFVTLFMGGLGISAVTGAMTDSIKNACLANSVPAALLAHKSYKHKRACQKQIAEKRRKGPHKCSFLTDTKNLEKLNRQLLLALANVAGSTACAIALKDDKDDKDDKDLLPLPLPCNDCNDGGYGSTTPYEILPRIQNPPPLTKADDIKSPSYQKAYEKKGGSTVSSLDSSLRNPLSSSQNSQSEKGEDSDKTSEQSETYDDQSGKLKGYTSGMGSGSSKKNSKAKGGSYGTRKDSFFSLLESFRKKKKKTHKSDYIPGYPSDVSDRVNESIIDVQNEVLAKICSRGDLRDCK